MNQLRLQQQNPRSGSTAWLSKVLWIALSFQLGFLFCYYLHAEETGKLWWDTSRPSSSLPHIAHYSPYRYERHRVPIKGPLQTDWLDMFRYLPLVMRYEFTLNGTVAVDDGTPSKMSTPSLSEEQRLKVSYQKNHISAGQVYAPLVNRTDLFSYWRGDGKQVWKKELIDFLIQEVHGGKDISCADYTSSALDVDSALKLLQLGPQHKLLVGGSLSPWVEAIALHHGVGQVVTTDYNEPICDSCHDRLSTISMDELMRFSTTAEYSHIISYSSVEHDGLGRYGDPLDPWGDMHAMKEFWSLLKVGGVLMLAVPAWSPDELVQLLARCYGPLRLPLLIQGWEYMGTVSRGHFSTSIPFKKDWSWHPIILLKKQGNTAEPSSYSCSINCTFHKRKDHLWLSKHPACAASATCGSMQNQFPALSSTKQIQSGDVINTWELYPNGVV